MRIGWIAVCVLVLAGLLQGLQERSSRALSLPPAIGTESGSAGGCKVSRCFKCAMPVACDPDFDIGVMCPRTCTGVSECVVTPMELESSSVAQSDGDTCFSCVEQTSGCTSTKAFWAFRHRQ